MRLLLIGFVVGLGCAAPSTKPSTTPSTKPATNAPMKGGPAPASAGVTAPPPSPGARIKDSVPERSASLNDADRDLREGATEQRFGFDEARARREAANKAKAGNAGAPPEPGLGSNGSLIPSPRQ